MSKWISVDERLPTNLDDVWVVINGDVEIGCYAVWASGWVRWDEFGNCYVIRGVTHWQPAHKPTPPADESDSTRPELVVEYDTATMDG